MVEELIHVLGADGEVQVPVPAWHYEEAEPRSGTTIPLHDALLKCYDLRCCPVSILPCCPTGFVLLVVPNLPLDLLYFNLTVLIERQVLVSCSSPSWVCVVHIVCEWSQLQPLLFRQDGGTSDCPN